MAYIRKKRHSIPGLNTTSTADISFMLLIFFLVTTSMDVNKGLIRRMPPVENEKVEQLQDIDQANVLTIHLLADGKVMVNDVESMTDVALRKDVRHFIIERGKQHVIELQIDKEAKYDRYFHIQNQIVLAYNEIRDAAAKKKFGVSYSACSEEERETIQKFYPQRMTEKYD